MIMGIPSAIGILLWMYICRRVSARTDGEILDNDFYKDIRIPLEEEDE